MKPHESLRSAGRSDRGPRARNEDRFFRLSRGGAGVFAVADGLGGLAGGQVASTRAIEAVSSRVPELLAAVASGTDGAEKSLAALFSEIDADLRRMGAADPVLTGLGTTLTVAALAAGRLVFAHVGDSRLYLRSGADPAAPLARLSEDMNLAMRLVSEGRLDPREYATSPHRARLLAYLGKGGVRPQTGGVTLHSGLDATIVLATDGLSGPVAEPEIAATLRQAPDPEDAAESLVRLAVARGAADNVTVVVAALGAGRPAPASATHST